MGVPAFTADDPAETKPQVTASGFHGPIIVTMNGETTGMPTGTDKLMKLELTNGFIIKILRNRVSYIDR